MLVDLNIPWPVTNYTDTIQLTDIERLKNIVKMMIQLQYTHIAVNFQLDPSIKITKKTFSDKAIKVNPMDFSIFKEFDQKIKIYSRITLTFEEMENFPGMKLFNEFFDIIAIKPNNDKGLSQCLTNFEFDLITFDYNENLRYWLKNKTIHNGIAKGRKFEIIYKDLLNSEKRKSCLSVSKNLIRASRGGNGLIISSGAEKPVEIKSKFDLEIILKIMKVNVSKIGVILNDNPVKVVLNGKLRVGSYKQTVYKGGDILETKIKRKVEDYEIAMMKKLQKLN